MHFLIKYIKLLTLNVINSPPVAASTDDDVDVDAVAGTAVDDADVIVDAATDTAVDVDVVVGTAVDVDVAVGTAVDAVASWIVDPDPDIVS